MGYEVSPEAWEEVLAGLDHRERGGYERVSVSLHLMPDPNALETEGSTVEGLTYIATPENPNYVGFAPIDEIAMQASSAHGPSGPNAEYVAELARSLREMGATDSHVFAVEQALLAKEVARRGGGGS